MVCQSSCFAGVIIALGQNRSNHKIEVDVLDAQALQRGLNALVDPLVPRVVELRGDPDLLAGDAGVLDALANFMFVSVR